ncbi:hypothetical protein ACH4E7_37420 [Kitasatospora sp. NPDC018058]|uniref:hypothetical protein n=1 Tax=Kitasatospora sp. NPDC018058 TaxID=3364025 RepID=UPI0037BE96F0
MDVTWLADRLDGRPRVVVSTTSTGPGLRRELWVAYLYGYRPVEHRPAAGAGGWTVLVLDPDPAARHRAEWMRNPDLRPGAPSPVSWTGGRGDSRAEPLWTPPGWPPGAGPVLPSDDLLPRIPPGHRGTRRRTVWLTCGVITAWAINVVRWAWSGTPEMAGLVLSGFLGALVLLTCAIAARRSRRRAWKAQVDAERPGA